jgi:uncharacterized integral membrane protein (TIGR00698 family)
MMTKNISGMSLAAVLGFAAFFIAAYTPSFLNTYLLALLFGMFLAPLLSKKPSLNPGISWSAAKMLEWSVVLLAFSLDYKAIAEIGLTSFAAIGIVVFVVLIAAYYLSKVLSCPGKTGLLIGFGTAICGSSAVAALAPKIKAKEEDVAISLAVVNLYGTLGMLLLPFLFQLFPQALNEMAFLIGASLHSVGNVAGAGFAVSDEVGQLALVYKMARVALLSPALIFMSWLDARGKEKAKFEWKLPWYLMSFLLISILVSFFPLSTNVLSVTELLGKIILTIAMAAIGLKVNFLHLMKAGRRGLVFALLVFVLQISLLWMVK